LLEAVSQVESAIEQKRLQQKAIDPKLEEAKRALKGAIEKYSQEEAKGDKADQELLKKHKDAGTRFKADVDRMTKQKAALDEEIKAQEPQITQLESRLTAMQTTIRNLPQQKAEKIAQFISNKAIIDANAKLNNLKSSADHSPLDAVDKALSDQSAKAKVSSRIAGTDSDAQRNEYVAAGETESASDDFDALVAAHKAEKAAKTGAVPVAPERDKI
jgi:chromosome segregation ATPase